MNYLFITVFFILGTVRFGNGMSVYNGMLSAAEFIIIAEYPCEEPAISNPEFVVRPGDSFDMTMDLDTQIDNTYKIVIQIDKFVGNKWQENFFNAQGKLCDLFNRYQSKGWEKVRMATNPQITDKCIIPKGNYVAKNISMSPADLSTPTVLYGIWKIFIRIYNSDDELFMCQVLEAETQRNL